MQIELSGHTGHEGELVKDDMPGAEEECRLAGGALVDCEVGDAGDIVAD